MTKDGEEQLKEEAEKEHSREECQKEPEIEAKADGLSDAEKENKKNDAKSKKIKIDAEELESLKKQVSEFAELKDSMIRKVADFENAKKRLIKEKEDFAKFANEKIVSAFLPVLDNLDRALAHREATESAESLMSGVELIRKQIFSILKDNGLEEVEAVGKEFDPHLHEALGMVKTSEHPSGYVVEQVQTGYKLKDRLLRPSWVRVAEETDEVKTDESVDVKADTFEASE